VKMATRIDRRFLATIDPLLLRHIYNAQHAGAVAYMMSFEVYCMQSDCPAVMHATLNNERLFARARGVGKGLFQLTVNVGH